MQNAELTEARRRLAQSRTWFARLVEKNNKAEAEYIAKIERQQAHLEQLEAESK